MLLISYDSSELLKDRKGLEISVTYTLPTRYFAGTPSFTTTWVLSRRWECALNRFISVDQETFSLHGTLLAVDLSSCIGLPAGHHSCF